MNFIIKLEHSVKSAEHIDVMKDGDNEDAIFGGFSMNLEEINKKRAKLQSELAELNAEAAKKTSKVAVICESNAAYGKGCGAGFYINELDYIQTHWYESPHGCTGGDNWHQGEGQFICPKCGHRNRFLNRQDIEALKYKFKSVINEYKE